MHGLKSLMVLVVIVASALVPGGCTAHVKEPAVAGSFYPAKKDDLAKQVDGYIGAAAAPAASGRLLALIAPHAGYQYSGAVAGHAYAAIKNSAIDTVIVIGPSHKASFTGVSVYTGSGVRTPLGVIPVNRKIAEALLNEKAGVTYNPAAFAAEHSVEVQFPFLQRSLRNFTVVPIVIGMPTRESFAFLTDKLAELLRGNERAIIVASTDFSHYHDRSKAAGMDKLAIDAIERLSLNDLESKLSRREGEMCGGFPVLYTMGVVRALGGTNGVLYRYADSGDVNGDTKNVVGYAAMGLYRSPLSAEEKRELLALARATVQNHVSGKALPEPALATSRLKADGATFVTLNDKRGNLRGCIGNIMPTGPLNRSVMHNAVSAATRDGRFTPVKPEELPDLHVEVTVLSPLEPLADINEIKIGTHGLYLEKGMQSGVFLPQVPVQWGWNTATYLEELARKAGLPKDGWKGAKLYTFTAEVIQ